MLGFGEAQEKSLILKWRAGRVSCKDDIYMEKLLGGDDKYTGRLPGGGDSYMGSPWKR